MTCAYIDRYCFENGCSCMYYGVDKNAIEISQRNEVLEEVAKEFDKMKNGGDTAHSFAIFVRNMKR